MSTDSPYPSRRALREQGLTTGSIQALTETGSIPPQPEQLPPPLTRRERRERERLAETGSLPRPSQDVTAATEAPATESPATESPATDSPVAPSTTSAPATDPDGSSPPVATTVSASPAPATRPLTRRERREMERRGEQVPETGMIPVVVDEPVLTEAESDGEATVPEGEVEPEPRAVVDEVIEQEPPASPQPVASPEELSRVARERESSSIEEDESPAPEDAEEPAEPVALPPVFAPAPSPEVHTASSREVSVASDQTNALILPVAPAMDLTGPMGDTGEVLVTGNIPLPKQVSEQAITGIVEVDSDEYDVTDTGTFSNPIRATQAVSSRSLELAPPMIRKPRWGAASIVLAFSSAVLAVAAVGLLALALMTDLIVFPSP